MNAWFLGMWETSMAVYLFYPRRLHGTALTFEAYDCADDGETGDQALAVPAEHHSTVEVAIWRGERLVAVSGRKQR